MCLSKTRYIYIYIYIRKEKSFEREFFFFLFGEKKMDSRVAVMVPRPTIYIVG